MLKAMANIKHDKTSSSSRFWKWHTKNFRQNLKSTVLDRSHKCRWSKCGCPSNFFKHKAIQRMLSRFGYQRQNTSPHCQGTPGSPILKRCTLKTQKANNNGSQRHLTMIDNRSRAHPKLSQTQTMILLKLLQAQPNGIPFYLPPSTRNVFQGSRWNLWSPYIPQSPKKGQSRLSQNHLPQWVPVSPRLYHHLKGC